MIEHSRLVEYFVDSEDSTQASRLLSERDADYYDGNQLTSEELKTLAQRKQPPVINNRIKPKIDYMLGAELKTRTDPKAFPRNPQTDEDAANAATDSLRYVCDRTKFERVRSLCYEDGLKYGSYGSQMVVTPKGSDYNIDVVHVPWDRMFWDPHSRAKDFSDSKYKGVVIWQDKEDALDSPLYTAKNKATHISDNSESTNSTETYGDKPQHRWTDAKRNRVRVVYMEYLYKGEWYFCYFTKSGFLRDPAKIPFVDDDGQSVPSLEYQSLFVDRDGNRYGQVRQYISMQDEINKRRSKGLHLLNSRQTIGEKGAVENVAAAKRELAKPDGHIEVTPGMEFKIQETSDMSAGNFNMLQEAKNEIDAQGPNAAMVGAEKRDLSGRAIQALQSGGNTETSIQTDGLRDWEHRNYRLIWYCIKKYWTAEKWFRVTDDENAPKYVGLNTPTTAGEQFKKQMEKQGQQVDEQMLAQIPEAQAPIVSNNVAQLDVDIILEDVPDTVTIQQEQFEALTQIYPTVPDQLKGLAFEMLVEASSLRNKKKIIDKLQGKGEQPDPMQEMQKQMAQVMAQLAVQEKQAEIAKTEEETKKIGTAALLDVARAEAAEKGQQLEEYRHMLEEFKFAFSQVVQPQPAQSQLPQQQPQAAGPQGVTQ